MIRRYVNLLKTFTRSANQNGNALLPRTVIDPSPIRTQVTLDCPAGTKVYWLDVPEGSVLTNDYVEIAEEHGSWRVTRVNMSLPEAKITVPHRLGTLQFLSRKPQSLNL